MLGTGIFSVVFVFFLHLDLIGHHVEGENHTEIKTTFVGTNQFMWTGLTLSLFLNVVGITIGK